MNTIWKFPLSITDAQVIEMPACATKLTVMMQYGRPCLWAIVDTEDVIVKKTFYIVGTGNEMPENSCTYVGSVIDGSFVWHIF